VDQRVPHLLDRLRERGADFCWHKHGTFKQHLLGVWKILSIWNQPQALARCGLFHSAYSNSYVNLAIFKAGHDRTLVQQDCGEEAEDLIYKFCVIPRQQIIVDTLYPMEAVPAEGLTVKHIHTGEDVHLSPELLGHLLVMTMADVADQQYGWQDDLFGDAQWRPASEAESMAAAPTMHPYTLWPGVSKPGLWMYFVSKMGTLARSCPLPVLPPVFDQGQFLLDRTAERQARDLYWEVISEDPRDRTKIDANIQRLKAALALNPYLAEPNTLLAQMYLVQGNFDDALAAADRALELFTQWGCPWDKRVSFEAWIAWTRVLLQHAEDKTIWHANSWGVINLGFVR
jgi:hypothetical protein